MVTNYLIGQKQLKTNNYETTKNNIDNNEISNNNNL